MSIKLQASKLGPQNIGQSVNFCPPPGAVEDSETPIKVLGRLQAIETYESTYGVVVGGCSYVLDPDHEIYVFRGMELNNIQAIWSAIDALVGELTEEDEEDYAPPLSRLPGEVAA